MGSILLQWIVKWILELDTYNWDVGQVQQSTNAAVEEQTARLKALDAPIKEVAAPEKKIAPPTIRYNTLSTFSWDQDTDKVKVRFLSWHSLWLLHICITISLIVVCDERSFTCLNIYKKRFEHWHKVSVGHHNAHVPVSQCMITSKFCHGFEVQNRCTPLTCVVITYVIGQLGRTTVWEYRRSMNSVSSGLHNSPLSLE